MSSAKEIIIPDSAIIDIAESDLEVLDWCINRYGFQRAATRATGVKRDTQLEYLEKKQGQKAKVEKLIAYAKQYKEKTAA